jgi:hypothetical protein
MHSPRHPERSLLCSQQFKVADKNKPRRFSSKYVGRVGKSSSKDIQNFGRMFIAKSNHTRANSVTDNDNKISSYKEKHDHRKITYIEVEVCGVSACAAKNSQARHIRYHPSHMLGGLRVDYFESQLGKPTKTIASIKQSIERAFSISDQSASRKLTPRGMEHALQRPNSQH